MSLCSPYTGRVKLFVDSSERTAMLEFTKNPIIRGFTTNPTLMRQAGISDYRAFCKEILTHIDKPISFEVFADDFPNMQRQAREISSWAPNIYVKIPVTNSTGLPSTELIRELSHTGVQVNVTAICTLGQVYEVCQALRGGGPSIVSVFAGRIADTGRDPVPLMQAALEICMAAGNSIELLWASPREVLNIVQADVVGCHIITVTPDLLKKLPTFNKDLAAFSLETVRMFKSDAEAAGYTL